MMRIGLVRFFNARPLDFGIRQARANPDLSIVEDTPARLFEALRKRELDAALISSVEAIRNSQSLACCTSIGVCARESVHSIIYLRPREDPSSSEEATALTAIRRAPPKKIFADNGSRTSIALLQHLLQQEYGHTIPFEIIAPERIPDLITHDCGGLLIGDSAMKFRSDPKSAAFDMRDLASWWYETEGLPFVFALWAYPREHPLPDSFFEESLRAGEQNMAAIIRSAPYPGAERYLREILHYRLDDADRRGLERFSAVLEQDSLL